MKKFILAILAAAAMQGQMQAQAQAQGAQGREAAFQAGEKLSFAVRHSYVRANIIDVTFSTAADIAGGKSALRVTAQGRTLSLYRTFMDINDTYNTWLDTGTLRPLMYSSNLEENKYRFKANYLYNWDSNTVDTRYHKHSNPDTRRRLPLVDGSGDAIAILYNMRCDDISSWSVGSQRTMNLVLDDTIRVLRYRYIGRETKKIGKLGTFNTMKIVCSMAASSDPDAQVFAEGSELTLWLSDDRNHAPLYIESPIKIGSIVAALTSYEGLKYPLTSKVK